MVSSAVFREFVRTRIADLDLFHAPGVAAEAVLAAIERHRENDRRGREACDHWGPAASVSRVSLGAIDVAVKWCRWRGPRGACSDRIFGSRAARALAGARRLAVTDVATPEPYAIAERRRFGFPVESFLVTRYLGNASPLPAVLPEIATQPTRRRALADALGDLVGELHATGVDHADFKHSNLLVADAGGLLLVDLDSLVPARRPTWRRRVRALGQLEAYATDLYPWLPRTDRARFLRAYFARNPELLAKRGALVADVRRWVEVRLAEWSKKDRSGHIVYPLAPRGGAPPASRRE